MQGVGLNVECSVIGGISSAPFLSTYSPPDTQSELFEPFPKSWKSPTESMLRIYSGCDCSERGEYSSLSVAGSRAQRSGLRVKDSGLGHLISEG